MQGDEAEVNPLKPCKIAIVGALTAQMPTLKVSHTALRPLFDLLVYAGMEAVRLWMGPAKSDISHRGTSLITKPTPWVPTVGICLRSARYPCRGRKLVA